MADEHNMVDTCSAADAEAAAANDVRPDSGAQQSWPHALDLQPYAFVDDVLNAVRQSPAPTPNHNSGFHPCPC